MIQHSTTNHPVSGEEYEAAIAEADAQAEGLYTKAEQITEHADEWYDRARMLESELYELRKDGAFQ